VKSFPFKDSEVDADAPTVLVIDDDQTVRDLMTRFLHLEGYNVALAQDGAEGLERIRELKPAAVLLDILMPEVDGWTVLAACKDDPEIAEIPVIVLTISDNRKRAYALGASDFLVKPVDRNLLREVLGRHRGAHRHILLVDDDKENRRVMKDLVTREGFIVMEAGNGREALDQLANVVPDLILLDVLMPEMDGFEFIEALRAEPAWRSIPLVVVTAKDLSEQDRLRLSGHVENISHASASAPEEILERLRAVIRGGKGALPTNQGQDR
jgi:CheY-like chemotaxis protein